MSKDIIVLTPNGRRQKVKCSPDTTFLQVLEEVCEKQSFDPMLYGLTHHNRTLDLTTIIRFSNLPNKACLEMVEMERQIEDCNVIIALQLEDGDRRTHEFPSNTSLYEIIMSLAPQEVGNYEHPTVIYMRQEIHGAKALQEKTLRQLGLIRGRAILRLFNKSPEELKSQANVSSVLLPRADPENQETKQLPIDENASSDEGTGEPSCMSKPTSSKNVDFVSMIKQEKAKETEQCMHIDESDFLRQPSESTNVSEGDSNVTVKQIKKEEIKKTSQIAAENNADTAFLERRLNIESEVTFLGSQKAIAFTPPDDTSDDLEDLPDDFYELSVEEVRRLYHGLQRQRAEMENAPLLTNEKREEIDKQSLKEKVNTYKNVVVRIQFPDHIILQGVFEPMNTIGDVINFIKEHLRSPQEPFQIFTTPLKAPLDPNMTMLDAKFVPCVLIHFKRENETGEPYLKEDVYLKKTPSDAANILASKYRAHSRSTSNTGSANVETSGASTSKSSKLPKWFKI